MRFTALWFAVLVLRGLPCAAQPVVSNTRTNHSDPIPAIAMQYMAAHMLACAGGRSDADSVATRTWAFVLLRMPERASGSLKEGRGALPGAEATFLETAATQLQSEQYAEFTDYLAAYLPEVESSNALYVAHLANLRRVGGGGGVTTLATDSGIDFRPFAPGFGKPLIGIRLSDNWLREACSRGAYIRLAEELRVVSELRRQPLFNVTVTISPGTIEEPLRLEMASPVATDRRSATILRAKPALLGGSIRGESQSALEELVLTVLSAIGSSEARAGANPAATTDADNKPATPALRAP